MFCVYILLSESAARTYVGQTEDLEERVRKHNAGGVRSTKAYRPWRVIHVEEYGTRAEAMEREQWLKSRTGRKFVAALLQSGHG